MNNKLWIVAASAMAAAIALAAFVQAGHPPGTSKPLAEKGVAGRQASGIGGTGSRKAAVVPLPSEESTLVWVPKPPAETLALLGPTSGTEGDEYEVVFRPYGFGPAPGRQTGVVARIETLKALNGSRTLSQLERADVLLFVVEEDATGVERGGAYSGRVTLIETGGALGLRVDKVKRLRGLAFPGSP